MMTASKLVLVVGALAAMFAVILGAFGAHALKARLAPDLLAVYHTAVQYHFYHAFALLIVGVLMLKDFPQSLLQWSAALFGAGLLLFCGSLYVLAFSGLRWLGAITPFGGVAFITGWLLLALAVWRS